MVMVVVLLGTSWSIRYPTKHPSVPKRTTRKNYLSGVWMLGNLAFSYSFKSFGVPIVFQELCQLLTLMNKTDMIPAFTDFMMTRKENNIHAINFRFQYVLFVSFQLFPPISIHTAYMQRYPSPKTEIFVKEAIVQVTYNHC